MLGHRELVFDDYIDILKRRRWTLLLPILIIPALAFAVMQVVPKKFTSTTLVLVEQKQVPDDYVQPVLSSDVSGRLASLKEQVMSRSRLQPIIERYGLYPGTPTVSEKLAEMRKAIAVAPIKTDVPNRLASGIPGFTIAFTADKARTARDVCGEITTMFLNENLKAREQAVQGTTDFIKSQLEDAKRNLDDQDAKLAAFQRAHFGEMPEQSQSNMGLLTAMSAQVDATSQAINQLQQNRMYLESVIAQAAQETGTNPASPGAPSASALQQQLTKSQQTLDDLRTHYTPDYPDVVAAQREVDSLKAKIAEADKASTAAASATAKPATSTKIAARDTPQLAQMKAQLQGVVQAIEDKKRDQDRLRERLAQVQAHVQSSPNVQEQQKALTRDYQSALQFYNDLLAKREHSEMASDLEKKQQGEQFRVMDPPNLPDSPMFPDPKIFMGAGFALAIAFAIGMTAFYEYRDRTLRNERDIFAFTQLPTLGTIPLTSEETSSNGSRGLLPKRRSKEYAGVSE